MLYALKGKFQRIAQFFARSGMSANNASFLGALFVVFSTCSLYLAFSALPVRTYFLILFPFMVFFRLIFNALDGMLARQQGSASPMGELLNELSDIWGDTICYGVLFLIPQVDTVTLSIFIIFCWFAEFVGVCGRALPGNIRRHESVGGGKSERSLLFVFFSLACFISPTTFNYINPFILILSVLTFLTGVMRIYKIKKQVSGRDYQSHTSYGV